jgi:pyrrolysine biosynthesis protein PylC
VYLGAAAGYETVLFDRIAATPASGLADEVHVFDLLEDEEGARRWLSSCDAVLPACEDAATLAWLAERLPVWGVPFLFDARAYALTSSKLESDRLFARLDVPRPRPWPCDFPVIVKPSRASGSQGVALVFDPAELEAVAAALRRKGHEVVVQEYVSGPSLSLEMVAWGGQVRALPPTELEFDLSYDCKRVVAPAETPAWVLECFEKDSLCIAQELGLQGVMDVEAMVHGEEPKIIEIDARLPSQTPTVVYLASGMNLVELLVRSALEGTLPELSPEGSAPPRGVVYQHMQAAEGRLEVLGEHVMARARPLRRRRGWLGAQEVLTDWQPGRAEWSATVMTRADDLPAARKAAAAVTMRMANEFGLELVPETSPEGNRSAL